MKSLHLAKWYNRHYTDSMKTAISIPDTLFTSAERLAEQLGVSRSELYATAIQVYVEAHRRDDITKQLDAIYGDETSTLDPEIARLQMHSLPQDQ